jgi:hypothetical protein
MLMLSMQMQLVVMWQLWATECVLAFTGPAVKYMKSIDPRAKADEKADDDWADY